MINITIEKPTLHGQRWSLGGSQHFLWWINVAVVFAFLHLTQLFHDLNVKIDVFLLNLELLFSKFRYDLISLLNLILKLSYFHLLLTRSYWNNRRWPTFLLFKFFFKCMQLLHDELTFQLTSLLLIKYSL